MLHLCKIAVGARDIAHLREIQAARAVAEPPLRHRTRNMPRRAAEVTDGGSLFWVVTGAMVVRQRILRIAPDAWDDGSACTGLVLDPVLVPVAARRMKPFQGWRYLEARDAPADLVAAGPADGEHALPPALRQALRELRLL
jgi:hypothetical protein